MQETLKNDINKAPWYTDETQEFMLVPSKAVWAAQTLLRLMRREMMDLSPVIRTAIAECENSLEDEFLYPAGQPRPYEPNRCVLIAPWR